MPAPFHGPQPHRLPPRHDGGPPPPHPTPGHGPPQHGHRPVVIPHPPGHRPVHVPRPPGHGPAPTGPVAGWSCEHKFKEVLLRSPAHMPASVGGEFMSFLTPLNVGIMIASLVAWAVSHFFGVGEVVDAILLAVGVLTL